MSYVAPILSFLVESSKQNQTRDQIIKLLIIYFSPIFNIHRPTEENYK
jgi:hypothetical protein